MGRIFSKFIKEEKGQTLVEWIMILALILVVVILTITQIGRAAKDKGDNVLDGLS